MSCGFVIVFNTHTHTKKKREKREESWRGEVDDGLAAPDNDGESVCVSCMYGPYIQ